MVKRGSVLLRIDIDVDGDGTMTLDRRFVVDFGAEPDGPVLAHEIRWIFQSLIEILLHFDQFTSRSFTLTKKLFHIEPFDKDFKYTWSRNWEFN